MGRRKKAEEKPIRGVTIRKTAAGTEYLRISFTFKGKRFQKALNIPPTPHNISAANRKLEQIRLEIQMGTFDPDTHFHSPKPAQKDRKIRELVLERMERKRKLGGAKGWSESTYSERKKLFTKHLDPNFGHLTLPELTANHVRNWVSKQTFSLNHGQLIMSLLNPIVKEALADGTIDRHPYEHVQLSEYLSQPTLRQRRERIDPLSESEVFLILDATKDPQIRNYLQFMIFSGLRMQEGPVVRWDDVNWHDRTLTISRAVGVANNKEYLKTTKTDSERTVELTTPAWEALQSQRKYTQLEGGYIFKPLASSNPSKYDWISRTRIRSIWTRALSRAGVRSTNRSPKQTRHTFCSLMIAAGKPLTWVAQQAGHASLSMLEQHYAQSVRLAANKHQDYDFGQAIKEAREREQAAKGGQ